MRLHATTTLSARAFRRLTPVSPVARATFTKVVPRPAVSADHLAPGLRFECVEGDFKQLPDFDTLRPTVSGIDPRFGLLARTREDRFAFRFRGYLRVGTAGVYRLFVRSDDGSRLWIGDTLVVDNDGLHSAHEESGVIALASGLHPLTVAMFEQTGGFELEVFYEGPGLARQVIPAAALLHKE